MKTKIISLLVLILVNGTLFAQHNFSVEVTGVQPGKGYVFFGLYDKEKGFLDIESQIATAKVKANQNSVVYTFKNLPDGNYAIAVYQDVNSNGKCDRNMIGYPTEGFGFSKNYKPKLSAPNFDEVKIAIDQYATTSIALIGK
ncbi:hypothetical protein BSF41_18790 [Flavobacterium sp. ACN2]|uniref:DUF2141 domain-containing protein n=1 Tax=Flavobacterium sp. CFBP9031 TaxID=3096538 RepID=UPI000BB33551|nr:DUF2141 domain-containing protein [Flavobacterium sp. CFBP9031]MDY0988207.1 DUF2141 domain-containing protein [Flavobacterium sp. CFBP9031]PBI90208.1 hypothetical protein BSF41_18790 [Flavobacterium sp. ACN2]